MNRWTMYAALCVTVVLLALRMYAAQVLGFGDAESLYASYARHPQPVFRDHPGLIGVLARVAGGGDAPSPREAHVLTALLATAAPWVAAWAARMGGASWPGAAVTALVILLTPETCVGLFGLTPDLPLIVLWFAALGSAAAALRQKPGSARALSLYLAAGFAAGLACDAKLSGVLLVGGLAAAWLTLRDQRRTLGPWAGLLVAWVVFSPVVVDEVQRGFPMLRHRLVDTQAGAGLSLRNVAALLGGQLLYVTPPLFVAAWLVGRDLFRHRRDDATSHLLWWTTVSCSPLVLLACVSRVAEPHWVAPLYLGLPLHLARRFDQLPRLVGPRLARWSLGAAAAVSALAHVWVLLPMGPRLLGAAYVPRYDLANDLVAWRTGLPAVRRALTLSLAPDGPPVVVIGPHWTVCAQLHAGLPASVLVGCEGDGGHDFTDWLPPSTWARAPVLLYVTDDRFPQSSALQHTRRAEQVWEAHVHRGGRVVRTITIARFVHSARAGRP